VTTANTPFIVVGIDGSEPSRQALRWARYLAGPLQAHVRAVSVWRHPAAYGAIAFPSDWHPEDDARQMLTDTVREVSGTDQPDDLSMIIREGNTTKELLDESVGATMLVVGSRGYGGFTGLLLGSVSAGVAEHADCPVLVVHGDALPPGTA
jgi:nucleotide-binding universal stress UspA family protein